MQECSTNDTIQPHVLPFQTTAPSSSDLNLHAPAQTSIPPDGKSANKLAYRHSYRPTVDSAPISQPVRASSINNTFANSVTLSNIQTPCVSGNRNTTRAPTNLIGSAQVRAAGSDRISMALRNRDALPRTISPPGNKGPLFVSDV